MRNGAWERACGGISDVVKEAANRCCDIIEQRGESYRWDKEEDQRASFNVQGILPPAICSLMLTRVHMYAGVCAHTHTCGCASQRTTPSVNLSLLRHHPLFLGGRAHGVLVTVVLL